MTFEQWYKEFWRYGSSTDELRTRRAWVMARASVQPLVDGLVRTRHSDKHLASACDFLLEVGQFYQQHPELESKIYD